MKISNPFKKKASPTLATPSLEELHACALAFAEAVIANATVDEARVMELAAKNGRLYLEVDIVPGSAITIHIDPGQPKVFQINQQMKVSA